MSQPNPPSNQGHGVESSQHYTEQAIELERDEQQQPQLAWVVVESPDQSYLLQDDDYILDSYFNPEYDNWEVLIRLEPEETVE